MVQTKSGQDRLSPEQRYQEIYERVSTFTDKLGTPLDPGIVETVVALNLLGLQTFQSCEGHLDHGCPYPWVTVLNQEHSSRYVRKWQQVCALEEEAQQAGTEQAYDRYLAANVALRLCLREWKSDDTLFHRLTALLDAFYGMVRDRAPSASRLMVLRIHPGMCRIEPGWSSFAKELPEPLKERYLAYSQLEMQHFSAYLVGKWQQEQATSPEEKQEAQTGCQSHQDPLSLRTTRRGC
jgi:hypothetical protein